MAKNIPDSGKEVVEEAQYKIVATMSIAGLSPHAIAQELKMTRYMVKKIRASEEFKTYLEELKDKAVTEAVSTWKVALSQATPEVIQLFKDLVAAKNPRALDVYLKTIGIEKEQVQQQASNITVMLPDLTMGKTIEVSND